MLADARAVMSDPSLASAFADAALGEFASATRTQCGGRIPPKEFVNQSQRCSILVVEACNVSSSS